MKNHHTIITHHTTHSADGPWNEFENLRNPGILGDQPNHNKQSWNQLQRITPDNKEDSTPDFNTL